MKATIKIPTVQFGYIELVDLDVSLEQLVNTHNELLGLYQLSKMKKMGASVEADHEKVKKDFGV